jgi:phosphopantothenoylcysteine decarboxylase/phosphopantothenate--cysteine ligase
VEILKARGHYFVDPEPGQLACGMEGEGKLAAVDVIVGRILEALHAGKSLSGLKVLVTAGPTVEDIDPIRFISNRSSGKMGYAVAQTAFQRGAEVCLVSGPTNIKAPAGINLIQVRSAAQMKEAVLGLYPNIDIVVKAAAVADYRPAEPAAQKIKKKNESANLQLIPTEDILELLGREKKHQILVGFAAETEHLLDFAREKLIRKNLDLLVANDVSADVFGADSATVHILARTGETVTLPEQSKVSIANKLLDMARDIHLSRKK